jgi:hypothetical protein
MAEERAVERAAAGQVVETGQAKAQLQRRMNEARDSISQPRRTSGFAWVDEFCTTTWSS